MYDPTTAQWTTEDPIEFDAGDPNLRRYVGNDPVNETDPTGLYEIDVHFYMTYYLALSVGLGNYKTAFKTKSGQSVSEAYLIAWAAQYTDVYSKTEPVYTGVDVRKRFHFRLEPGSDTVAAWSNAAQSVANQGIDAKDPILFGIGLHAFEDSWSHAGYGAVLGHGIDSKLGNSPDQPFKDQFKSRDLIEAVYGKMAAWMVATHQMGPAKPFKDVLKNLTNLMATKGTEAERVRKWQEQIKKDFGITVNFQGEDDTHPWAKSFDTAASKVKP